ncbi:MAG: EamA family transporter [Prevotella sp.]|jgi:undecaprenyl phosphate-alpha-L-ara4N flippase subunit ArnE|nr:EamA family transporter [Prevotella sp.]
MRLLLISIVQSVLLCGGQVLLKLALQRMGAFSWTLNFFIRNLDNWWLLACGICYALSTVLWLYIVRHFPFSMAYPMISLSYVFGMCAAILFFHEEVPLIRWAGVALIMLGCVLIAK